MIFTATKTWPVVISFLAAGFCFSMVWTVATKSSRGDADRILVSKLEAVLAVQKSSTAQMVASLKSIDDTLKTNRAETRYARAQVFEKLNIKAAVVPTQPSP